MANMKMIVGGSLDEDAAAFLDAWKRARRGKKLRERVLAFESWEALAIVLTGARYRMLRHLHAHPEPSVSALARALSANTGVFMPTSPPSSKRAFSPDPEAWCARRRIPSPPTYGFKGPSEDKLTQLARSEVAVATRVANRKYEVDR